MSEEKKNIEQNKEFDREGHKHFPEDNKSPKPAIPDMETHAHHLHKAQS